MDSSYYLVSNNTSTSASSLNNDLEQSSSSSSFNYDPFDGSFLDHQQGMRLYDYFGSSVGSVNSSAHTIGSGGGGRNSPLFINQCPLSSIDHLDLQQKNFPFQTDPNQEDDDDLQGTLTGFVGDLGVDCDAGYTSGVDLFSGNTIADCSDSTEAYYLRLAIEQNGGSNINNNNINGYNNNIYINNSNNYSDINNNNYNNNNNDSFNYDCISYSSCNGDSNKSQTAKRSVLMNLLIDGSDVGAGYTSHNRRALPQRIIQQQQQQQQQQQRLQQ